jgi:acetoin utilization deacetylase AcuC-like enzyme
MEQEGNGVNRLLWWRDPDMPEPRPALIRDPRFREHSSPGHPEGPQRLDAIDAALAPLAGQVLDLEPRAATDEEILRAHSRAHLDRLESVAGQVTQLDPDTYTSARSPEIARLAAGSAVELAQRVARGELRRAFALVRPPGHHAERHNAMGFCLLNQIAMTALALASQGVERIAVVDFDVHHGNGTQHILEEERDILFASLHQFPFYPGTGALREQGQGDGVGSTLNLPLPAGCGDAEYAAVCDAALFPVLDEFRPQIVLVSAGFDAHARDPLASMQLTTAGFARIVAGLRAIADSHCEGRLVFALEGGYDLDALGAAVRASIEVLCSENPQVGSAPKPSPVANELVALFREAHSPHWSALRGG